MDVHVFLTSSEVEPAVVAGRLAVVIDVLRATSTIVEALANGAAAVYPAASTEGALKLLSSLGREDTLLCGERRWLKVDGFDLGNSPSEYTAERVAGKRLVMSTTNGTEALTAAAGADRVVVGSFLNLGGVARAVSGEVSLAIICAGQENTFSLDDVVCAGTLLNRVSAVHGDQLSANDAALAAMALAERFEPGPGFLRQTLAGRSLSENGFGSDLEFCAQIDRHELVPEMRDRIIRAAVDGAA
jgi:2-phosphosulfolactate phosphatase